ncbi:ferredoxin [Mycolicibacterium bacteremicum]|uniref:(2Fe-2S) ferredoxin domain-containing protein n=1 Tax=Mycolicibacterium bacteremicum TaxID=564198 RepID=UPI0026F02F91|nr:(2Fe-2S) ferredoxin domain-containing protein [Mycolicibacterium bacteremicum]
MDNSSSGAAIDPQTLVLVGLGADTPGRHGDLLDLATYVNARVAYLQLGRPTLNEVLDDIADRSPGSSVRLVPLPVGASPAPARSWVRRVAGDWVRRHPHTLRVEVGSGEVSGQEAGLSSTAWAEVPPFGRHVLICRGPRCTAKGSAATAQALADELKRKGLGDDQVLVTQTGCLFPCNHAPVIAVYPDDEWWGPVSTDDVHTLVTAWAADGREGRCHPVRKPSPSAG